MSAAVGSSTAPPPSGNGLFRGYPQAAPAYVPPVASYGTAAASQPVINPQLRGLCVALDRKLSQRPSTHSALRPVAQQRRQLQEALDDMYEPCHVQQLPKATGNSLQDMVEAHTGPVVILDLHGRPEYIFERNEGQWQGYRATDFSPLSPGSSPGGALAHQAAQSRRKLSYQLFSIANWRATLQPESHDPSVLIIGQQRQRPAAADASDAPIPGAGPRGRERGDELRTGDPKEMLVHPASTPLVPPEARHDGGDVQGEPPQHRSGDVND
jgi:hypothetical protein